MRKAEPHHALALRVEKFMHQRRTVTAGAGADPVLMKKPVADLAGILFPKIQGNDRHAKSPAGSP